MNIFKNISFFFAPWHQGIECNSILIAPAVDTFLRAMQKHKELICSMDHQLVMLHTHSCNLVFSFFFEFFEFWDFLDIFDYVINWFSVPLSHIFVY